MGMFYILLKLLKIRIVNIKVIDDMQVIRNNLSYMGRIFQPDRLVSLW